MEKINLADMSSFYFTWYSVELVMNKNAAGFFSKFFSLQNMYSLKKTKTFSMKNGKNKGMIARISEGRNMKIEMKNQNQFFSGF